MATTFALDDKTYEISFNRKAIRSFERANGSLMAKFAQTSGMLATVDVESLLSLGLYYGDGGKVSPKQSLDVCDALMDEYGYTAVLNAIAEALERDCAFLLRGAGDADTIG